MEIIVFIAVIPLALFVTFIYFKNEQKRTASIEAAAKTLGFTFDKDTVHACTIASLPFKLFTTGHSKRTKNVMEQNGNDLSIAHFDYSYSIGSGKNKNIYNQTVTVFQSPKLNLPSFLMGPERFFHRIGDVLGFKDIDFDDEPEFSKIYLLKGNDEKAIRSFFDLSLLRFFKIRPGLSIETANNSLVVYNKSKRIKPDQINAVLKERIEIYTMLLNRSAK
ncbi:MAG: hypothetical protein ACM31E_10970 [Fibrobacterota bacterium]